MAKRNEIAVLNFPISDIRLLKSTIDLLLETKHKVNLLESNEMQKDVLEVGDLRINKSTGVVEIGGATKEILSPKELRILITLYTRINSCVNRRMLAENVWPQLVISDRTMESHISRLRKKISQSTTCSLEAVYGEGYTLSCI
jgi:DNA-binding response OmpR family regulator